MIEQQGDVILFQTDNGGDILVENGVVTMDGGIQTAAYLALFGGNEDDNGSQNTSLQWWGNIGKTAPGTQYRSETQFLLKSLPATSFNLRRIEDAARRDLAFFIEIGAATVIEIEATIPGLNRISISGSIDQYKFNFVENWSAHS